MAASEHLNPQQFFHGTSNKYDAGFELSGEESARLGGMNRVWATPSQGAASHYARQHATNMYDEGNKDARPHVYEVEPTHDSRSEETGISASRMRIKGEVAYTPPHKYAYPAPWERENGS